MAVKNEHGLTPQQEKFALEVASGKSLADAYRVAYPKSLKWAEAALWSQSSQLRSNGKVSKRINDLAQKVEQAFVVDKARVLREIARIAFSDIKRLTQNGKAQLPEELDDDTAAAVSAFKLDEYGRLEYKMWDKNAALEKLAKHLGLFKEDNEQTKPVVFHQIKLVGVRPNHDKADKG